MLKERAMVVGVEALVELGYHIGASAAPSALYWTFDVVEDRLIEAMRFAWRDEPGKWPFAGDGPWSLMQANSYYWDYKNESGRLLEGDVSAPRLALSRRERARMEQAVGWLRLLGDKGANKIRGGDARLVVLAVRKLAAHRGDGRGQVKWERLLARLGVQRGAGMLRKRYSRAIAEIAVSLDKSGLVVDLAR
jgi:hypothetical protein